LYNENMGYRELDLTFLEGDRHNRIVYTMPPHAPSLVTTISPNGTVNVGAFEQTMLCSNVPPVVLLAITSKSDTYKNLWDHGQCVIGFPYPEEAQKTYDAGVRLPRGESELNLIDFKTLPSKTVEPPRLAQCWWSGEGKLAWVQDAGDHMVCAIAISQIAVDDAYWQDDSVARRRDLNPLYYATGGYFFTPGEWKRVQRSPGLADLDPAD
jgi:flavin reductase (DIM6/NTAB) family NADH-FMN oxidoreductase RutF